MIGCSPILSARRMRGVNSIQSPIPIVEAISVFEVTDLACFAYPLNTIFFDERIAAIHPNGCFAQYICYRPDV